MKLSNIVLASIITTSLSVTAQVDSTQTKSVIIKQHKPVKPNTPQTVVAADSTALEQKKLLELKKQNDARHTMGYCPACGMG